ncbi:uncharacterized protein KZ484_020293 [Pholidichthys leucotaenia]
MSLVQHLSEFLKEPQTAAEEISEFEETTEERKSQRTDLIEQNASENMVSADQQLCNQDRISSLKQENPDTLEIKEEQEQSKLHIKQIKGEQEEPKNLQFKVKQEEPKLQQVKQEQEERKLLQVKQIKEEEEEHYIVQEEDHLFLKQESAGFMVTHRNEGSHKPEPNNDTLHPHDSDNIKIIQSPSKEISEDIQKVIVWYNEDGNNCQHRLLDVNMKPEPEWHRTDLIEQNASENMVSADQQLCNQDRISSLKQENPDTLEIKEEQEQSKLHIKQIKGEQEEPKNLQFKVKQEEPELQQVKQEQEERKLLQVKQIKEEEEEHYIVQEEDHLFLKQESAGFMVTHRNEGSHKPEPNNDTLYPHDSDNNKIIQSPSKEISEDIQKVIVWYNEDGNNCQHRLLDVNMKPEPEWHRTDLIEQNASENMVSADQQLCNQDRISSLKQENPDTLEIKEEQEQSKLHIKQIKGEQEEPKNLQFKVKQEEPELQQVKQEQEERKLLQVKQIKEEEEEHYIVQEEDHLFLKQESAGFMVTHRNEGSHKPEPNNDTLHPHDFDNIKIIQSPSKEISEDIQKVIVWYNEDGNNCQHRLLDVNMKPEPEWHRTDPELTQVSQLSEVETPSPAPTVYSSPSPAPSMSSSPSTSAMVSSSASGASGRTRLGKRRRDTSMELLQYLERSDNIQQEQNRRDEEMTSRVLQSLAETRATTATLVGLMERAVSVLEQQNATCSNCNSARET